MNYSNLIENNPDPNYSELLSTLEWKRKRKEILKRDDERCTNCSLGKTHDHYNSNGKFSSGITDDGLVTYVTKTNSEGVIVKFWEPKMIVTKKSYIMHVHHCYYVVDKLPWQYPSEALITLCNWCHSDFHEKNIMKVYLDTSLTKYRELVACKRCGGTGYFDNYRHVENGVCFECRGERFNMKIY